MLNGAAYAGGAATTLEGPAYIGSVGKGDSYELAFLLIDRLFNALLPFGPFGPGGTESSKADYHCSAESALFEAIGYYDTRAVQGGRIRVVGGVRNLWPFSTRKYTDLQLFGAIVDHPRATEAGK